MKSRTVLLGLGFAMIIASALIAFPAAYSESDTAASAPIARKGDIDCLVLVQTGENHSVVLSGSLGFMDFPNNPTNAEVDWDDGNWSSTTFTGGDWEDYVSFQHEYTTAGLRHIKFYVDDSTGDTCDSGHPTVFDVSVQ